MSAMFSPLIDPSSTPRWAQRNDEAHRYDRPREGFRRAPTRRSSLPPCAEATSDHSRRLPRAGRRHRGRDPFRGRRRRHEPAPRRGHRGGPARQRPAADAGAAALRRRRPPPRRHVRDRRGDVTRERLGGLEPPDRRDNGVARARSRRRAGARRGARRRTGDRRRHHQLHEHQGPARRGRLHLRRRGDVPFGRRPRRLADDRRLAARRERRERRAEVHRRRHAVGRARRDPDRRDHRATPGT